MAIISPVIFPDRVGQKAGYVNLDDCATHARRQDAISPFLNPDLTDRFLSRLHRRMHVDYSWGGYLEDRRHVWRGSYLQHDTAVHLAIDVNVPANTAVTVAQPSRVSSMIHDADQKGGWGSVIIFKLDQPLGDISHVLYAHLSKDSIQANINDVVKPGDVVGFIGRCHENGGWYEHLHVQAMTLEAWDMSKGDLTKFDGYGAMPQGAEHPFFPNPLALL